MSTGTVVYFESIQHTVHGPTARKTSALKIAPTKCTIYLCLRNVCSKNRAQYSCFLNIKVYFCDPFLKINVFSKNKMLVDNYRNTEYWLPHRIKKTLHKPGLLLCCASAVYCIHIKHSACILEFFRLWSSLQTHLINNDTTSDSSV